MPEDLNTLYRHDEQQSDSGAPCFKQLRRMGFYCREVSHFGDFSSRLRKQRRLEDLTWNQDIAISSQKDPLPKPYSSFTRPLPHSRPFLTTCALVQLGSMRKLLWFRVGGMNHWQVNLFMLIIDRVPSKSPCHASSKKVCRWICKNIWNTYWKWPSGPFIAAPRCYPEL